MLFVVDSSLFHRIRYDVASRSYHFIDAFRLFYEIFFFALLRLILLRWRSARILFNEMHGHLCHVLQSICRCIHCALYLQFASFMAINLVCLRSASCFQLFHFFPHSLSLHSLPPSSRWLGCPLLSPISSIHLAALCHFYVHIRIGISSFLFAKRDPLLIEREEFRIHFFFCLPLRRGVERRFLGAFFFSNGILLIRRCRRICADEQRNDCGERFARARLYKTQRNGK